MEPDINPHHFTLENFVYRNIILNNLIIPSYIFCELYLTPCFCALCSYLRFLFAPNHSPPST